MLLALRPLVRSEPAATLYLLAVAAAELPYSDIVVDFSDNDIANDIHITREGGTEQVARDASSIAAYMRHSLNESGGLHHSDTVALNAAQWTLFFRKDPKIRIERLTIKPHRDPDNLWPQVLGRELGDRIRVIRRPPNTATTTVSAYAIEIGNDFPIGYWTLDESSGTLADDLTVNNLDGTYTNSPGLNQTPRTSASGRAVFFDGASQYVALPNDALLNITGNITLEAWVKTPGSFTETGTLVGGYNASSGFGAGYGLLIRADGGIPAFWNGVSSYDAGPSITNNTWHHIVASLSGTTLSFYVDGVLVSSQTGVAAPTSYSGVRAIAAGAAGARHFAFGTLDDVAIYGTALSAARVLAHYQAAGSVATTANPPIESEVIIEGMTHTFAPGRRWETTWDLSPAINASYWVLGTHALGITSKLAY